MHFGKWGQSDYNRANILILDLAGWPFQTEKLKFLRSQDLCHLFIIKEREFSGFNSGRMGSETRLKREMRLRSDRENFFYCHVVNPAWKTSFSEHISWQVSQEAVDKKQICTISSVQLLQNDFYVLNCDILCTSIGRKSKRWI